MDTESVVTAYAVVVPRGPHWLVRITAPGMSRPMWRRYLRDAFPLPVLAALRAARHVAGGGKLVRVVTQGWL